MQPPGVFAAVLLLCISAAMAQETAKTEEAYEVDEAYRVYSVLLPREESYGFAKGTLVIQQDTVGKQAMTEKCLTAEAAKKFKDAITDFDRVNSKRWVLQRHFEVEKPYELVTQDTIRLFFKGNGDWNGFYDRYPGSGGYVILSAVGFDEDKTQAIVYTGSSCGGLCGRWSFHLLEKVDGKWKQVPGVSCLTVS